MLKRFMIVFVFNPITAKNRIIVKELLESGKIAT